MFEKLLAGEKTVLLLKLEHVSGVASAMFLLEKQFDFEVKNRDDPSFFNNPLLRFQHLTQNQKISERPAIKDEQFHFISHAHNFVENGT